jgi:DNA-directed RNA polymerase III subunit RPC2
MSKNRMIVEQDRKGNMSCQVTSSTHGTKTRTNVVVNKGKYYLKQNSFQDVN